MAISLSSLIQTNQVKPPRVLIHGVSGVGKTTFAAESKAPVFLQTEDGLGTINVPHFPLAHTWDEVLETLVALYQEKHDYRTLVIDSVDWLEPLIWAKTCRVNKWDSIEDPGYGKGYIAALSYWRDYIDAINALRNDRGMTVVQNIRIDSRSDQATIQRAMRQAQDSALAALKNDFKRGADFSRTVGIA
jgi:hypothetical protein